ncbi:MAG: inositol monophosphatase [Deltaproteobacteria bacterium]|nr:inositol monophosphatase [Deltaproteobacteria bacterium]
MSERTIEKVAEVLRAALEAAAGAALERLAAAREAETKSDGSPVTAADRAAEAAALEVIQGAFPGDAILGEETGEHAGGGWAWTIDPIDGTRGFVRGGESWGPLIAAAEAGVVRAGGMALAVRGRHYWAAEGMGAWRGDERIALAAPPPLERATLVVGELRPLLADPGGAAVRELIAEAACVRCPGDLASFAFFLDGHADAWLEAGVQPWDLGPFPILAREAGAVFTTARGTQDLGEGTGLVAREPLHGTLLARWKVALEG